VDAQRQPGTLTLVTTPIGNLQDLSPRAAAVLAAADLIVAEDTRRAQKLLSHLQLHKPLESFHGDSDTRKQDRLVRRLLAGEALAYVSDGGTPGIADPGRELVVAAVAAGVPVTPIPGPCALVTALSVSGMVADRFVFAGFPPRHARERAEFLGRFAATGLTVVLYEAPHRIVDTLQAIAQAFGERQVLVARELTKHYEELLRGTAAELAATFAEREPKGEFVIVIEGGAPSEPPATPQQLDGAVRRLVAAGLGPRDVAGVLVELGVAGRREAYQLALAVKKEASPAAGNGGDTHDT
jgi:16S rRNA (cytidine1402-2'-O)-methyltransferase